MFTAFTGCFDFEVCSIGDFFTSIFSSQVCTFVIVQVLAQVLELG